MQAPAMREEAPVARVAPSTSPQAFPMQQNVAPPQAPAGTAADAARTPAESQRQEPSAPARVKALAVDEAQRELERIATLRAQGRHAEADKALEEFRRTHPDYRIPDAMWERVKPR
jgi:hypothetical protein